LSGFLIQTLKWCFSWCILQVALLRQRFIHSISLGGLAGDRKDVLPASGFSFRAEQIWKTIKENKDLDLPALEVYLNADFFCKKYSCLIRFSCVNMFLHFVYQVMVATFRCEEIAKEKLSRLKLDEVFLFSFKCYCTTLL
jgi:hypothetical protein